MSFTKYLLTFLFGAGLASSLFIFLIMPHDHAHAEDDGRRSGEISTKLEFVEKIPKALGGDFQKTEKFEPFFSVKATDVVVVERNGVKTLRVY